MSWSARCGGFLLAAALVLLCHPALAEKRVALVIGNSAYQNVPQLTNPANDGAVMTTTFKNAGFDVVDYRRDLTARETRRALRDFADAARDADIAVVYYAGHGMEVEGSNYLIPIDARLERDTDVYDETLSLDRILVAVEPAKKLRLVILDACRDNPFTRTMQRTVATRSLGRGLAKVEPTSPNTLIAYSAKAGSTAQDGDGTNSPFTLALSRHIATPGLDVRKAFGFVRDEVLKSTSNRQEPFVYGSLGGEDVPLVPGVPRVVTQMPVAPPVNAQADTRRDYELAMQIGNKGALNAFLAQYPDGFYASLAKLQRDKYVADEAHAAAVEKARQADQERLRLAALGAQKDTQARADADARAAEQARLDAERAQQAAQQQASDAERKRLDPAARNATLAPAAPAPAPEKAMNVASLNPAPTQADINKSVQTELRRVGCYSGNADGDWDSASQRSLSQFNRNAGLKLDVKNANADTLDAIRQKSTRVCPLVCDHGFKADGDHCTRIVCAEGSFVNSDNECEKQRARPAAKRDDADRPSRRARQDDLDRQERPVARAPRGGYGYDAGYGAMPPRQQQQPQSRPLTGSERMLGCNSNEAIMSGKCPN